MVLNSERWPLSCLVLSGMGLREWGDTFSSIFIGSERIFLIEFSVSIGPRWQFFTDVADFQFADVPAISLIFQVKYVEPRRMERSRVSYAVRTHYPFLKLFNRGRPFLGAVLPLPKTD